MFEVVIDGSLVCSKKTNRRVPRRGAAGGTNPRRVGAVGAGRLFDKYFLPPSLLPSLPQPTRTYDIYALRLLTSSPPAMTVVMITMAVMPELVMMAVMVSVVPPGPDDATGQIRSHYRYKQ
jgi:hypothetical protein